MESVKQDERATIGDVRKLIEQGLAITTAIKAVLERNGLASVTAFAEKYDLNRSATANYLSGSVRPSEEAVTALISGLGGTDAEWREILWLAGKPAISA